MISAETKQNNDISSELLITNEEVDNPDKNSQENTPVMGLNSPVFLEENSSQSPERNSRLFVGKTIENGNYLRERTETIVQTIEARRPERASYSSTTSPYTPFPGFQIPNETIIPMEGDLAYGKKNRGLTAQEAIPVLPRSAAILCLVLNIIIPGLGRFRFPVKHRIFRSCCQNGTAMSGLIAFFLTRREVPLMNRTTMLCVNCFVAVMQLSTVVFLLIGWVWSITWGCAFVGLSEQYGRQAEKVEGGEAVA